MNLIIIYGIALIIWEYIIIPFFAWWSIVSLFLIILAEVVYYFIPIHCIALRSTLWRVITVGILLLPLSLAFSPLKTNFSLPGVNTTANRVGDGQLKTDNAAFLKTSVINKSSVDEKVSGIQDTGKADISHSSNSLSESIFSSKMTKPDTLPFDPYYSFPISFLLYFGILFSVLFIRMLKKRSIRLLINSSTKHDGAILENLLESGKQQLHIKKNIEIRISEKCNSPVIICFRQPVLLLPEYMVETWNESELLPIIMHELNHIARHDYLYDKICGFLATVMFFNPVWILLRKRLEGTRELFCDAIAANACNDSCFLRSTINPDYGKIY